MNHTKDLKREVCQQIQVRKRTWQKFSLFWKDSNTNKKWQLIIYDIAIKSKFLYNLEIIYFTKSLINKLDAFHFRGLRKILNLNTTYTDYRNINVRVYYLASNTVYLNNPHRKIKCFSEELEERRVHLAKHILRADDTDPMQQVSYQPRSTNPLQIGKRREGHPRQQWIFKINKAIHNRIK